MITLDFPEELIVDIYKRIGVSYAIKLFQKLSLVNYQWYRISKDRALTVYCVCYNECNSDHIGCVIYKNPNSKEQLYIASKNGHLNVVKYLYRLDADIHAYQDCALRFASLNGHLKVVK